MFVRGVKSLTKYRNVKHQLFYGEDYGEVSWLPLLPSTGMVKGINLINYAPGFVVVPEDRQFEEIPKLFQAFFEYDQWLKVLGISDVGDINALTQGREITELIKVAEALHEKRVSYIADEIKKKEAKLILVAGPSSSGKTSFSHRLAVQLRQNTFKGSLPAFGAISGYGASSYVMKYVTEPKKAFKWFFMGFGISSILYILLTLATTLVFVPEFLQKLTFSHFVSVQGNRIWNRFL